MNGINNIKNIFNTLERYGDKYSGYNFDSLSNIVYCDPETPEQEALANSIAKKNNNSVVLYIFAFIFIAVAIYAAVVTANITFTSIMFVVCALIFSFVIRNIKNRSKKTQIFIGKVMYKYVDNSNGYNGSRRGGFKPNVDMRHNSITINAGVCRVSVIPYSGEKVIYKDIPIAKKDYKQVTEGSIVMVVNKGPCAGIVPDNMIF